MQITYRQGVLRGEVDSIHNNAAKYLQASGQSVNIIATASPLVVTVANKDKNYLIREEHPVNAAWSTLPINGTSTLYWDVDVSTGIVTRGSFLGSYRVATVAPVSPTINDHWFDLTNTQMNFWDGSFWVPVIRVFAGTFSSVDGAIPYDFVSQANLTGDFVAGFIEYDLNARGIKNPSGTFLTTADPRVVQIGDFNQPLSAAGSPMYLTAYEPIPAFSLVAVAGDNSIKLANNNTSDWAVGLIDTAATVGSSVSLLFNGIIENPAWDFSASLGLPLWLDANGQVSINRPLTAIAQTIGVVLTSRSIILGLKLDTIVTNVPILGFSGQNGLSGTSGFSGARGPVGSTGLVGPTGETGLTGPLGPRGLTGLSGFSGLSGYSGKSGWSGLSGFSGWSGARGSIGMIGLTGLDGPIGPRGQTGLSGWSGLSGFSGWSGARGLNGVGLVGADGPQGIRGFSGFSGYSGKDGASGFSGLTVVGFSGFSGFSGVSGLNGASGYSGISGFSGASGISGFSGYSGLLGPRGLGISGYSGMSGDSGYSGLKGEIGERGSAGLSGISGYSGLVGRSGFSGFSGLGLSGYSGVQGEIGVRGFPGLSGFSGYSGLSVSYTPFAVRALALLKPSGTALGIPVGNNITANGTNLTYIGTTGSIIETPIPLNQVWRFMGASTDGTAHFHLFVRIS